MIEFAIKQRIEKKPVKKVQIVQKDDSPQRIRIGATRPADGGDLFRKLMEQKNDPKYRSGGIGNAATGMYFKSIYLGQGHSDL